MPGFDPDRINIHELAIEEPEKQAERVFDFESAVSQEDWEKAKGIFTKDLNWRFVFEPAAAMKIVFPERDIGLKLDEETWKGLYGKYEDDINLTDYTDALSKAADIKVLFPESELCIDLEDNDLLDMKIEHLIESGDWEGLLDVAEDIAIVYPDQPMPRPIKKKWKAIEKYLKSFGPGTVQFFTAGYASARIAFPQKVASLNVDEKKKQEMIDQLERFRGNPGTFFKYAASLKIALADKVEVTEKGLELTMPTPKKKAELTSQTPEMPETKQF